MKSALRAARTLLGDACDLLQDMSDALPDYLMTSVVLVALLVLTVQAIIQTWSTLAAFYVLGGQ